MSQKAYNCPVELVADLLGGKWRVVILALLKEGVHRYGELRRCLPGISDKMLAQCLRELRDAGFVERFDLRTKPAHVEYQLTEEGKSLGPILQAMYDWGLERAERTGTPVASLLRSREGKASPAG